MIASMHVIRSTIGGYADDTDLPAETASGIKRETRIIPFTQHTALARRFKVIPRLSGNCESLDRRFFQDLEWLLRARRGHPGHVKNSFLLCRSSDSRFCDRHVEYPLGDLHDCKIRQRRADQKFQHLLKFPQARKDYCERPITTNHGFRTARSQIQMSETSNPAIQR